MDSKKYFTEELQNYKRELNKQEALHPNKRDKKYVKQVKKDIAEVEGILQEIARVEASFKF